jgi:hypothetical protein
VEWLSATLDRVWLESAEGGGPSPSGPDQLVITLRVTDHDPDRKVDYAGWASRPGRPRDESLRATLTDEFGNRYKPVHFGAGSSVRGQRFEESVYPGGMVDDVLVFEKPVKSAGELRLHLPGEAVGVKGAFRLVRRGPPSPARAAEGPP